MSTAASTRRARSSPWARLNLRHNPFGEPTPAEEAALLVVPGSQALAEAVRTPGTALQMLGECGRGKTARLRLLEHRFPGAPYVYLPEDGPLPALPRLRRRAGGGPALLLDEAQRLPRRHLRRLSRHAARSGTSLALATHRDLARELAAAGLRVATVRVEGLEVEHLLAIVGRRLRWARAAPGPVPELDRESARRLVERFGDDLRALLDHLYELYQDHLDRPEEDTPWRSAI